MIVKSSEPLNKYTTIRIGGIAEKLYFPECEDELQLLLKENDEYLILSGGSNLLINDTRTFPCVISMSKVNNQIVNRRNGKVYCGASVRLSRLIKEINSFGYGGIEELISIPGMLGGGIYMNASIGSASVCISDYIKSVTALYENKIVTLAKEQCRFSHRYSIFQNNKYIILSAEFVFPEQLREESLRRINQRRNTAKVYLDMSSPNFGSVFKQCDYRIMSILGKLGLRCGGVRLSSKTPNWILNEKGGSYNDIMHLIDKCVYIHKVLRKDIQLEVRMWE